MGTPKWKGQHTKDRHRTCGGRAWCLNCGEWCYAFDFCSCCFKIEADGGVMGVLGSVT